MSSTLTQVTGTVVGRAWEFAHNGIEYRAESHNGTTVELLWRTAGTKGSFAYRGSRHTHELGARGTAEAWAQEIASSELTVRQYAVRMRHDAGTTTFVTAARSPAVAVELILTAQLAPERSVQWVAEQPTCEYCASRATRRVRETQEVICASCARSQTDGPVREYVTTLANTQWPRVDWK